MRNREHTARKGTGVLGKTEQTARPAGIEEHGANCPKGARVFGKERASRSKGTAVIEKQGADRSKGIVFET